jgi:RNA recognition motif-containing protein
MKLYVGNLSFDITERTLRELFEPFGTVSEVKLIMDRETGQSRGFGFVTMGNVSEGNAAIRPARTIRTKSSRIIVCGDWNGGM